jgi:hypothetical protein
VVPRSYEVARAAELVQIGLSTTPDAVLFLFLVLIFPSVVKPDDAAPFTSNADKDYNVRLTEHIAQQNEESIGLVCTIAAQPTCFFHPPAVRLDSLWVCVGLIRVGTSLVKLSFLNNPES